MGRLFLIAGLLALLPSCAMRGNRPIPGSVGGAARLAVGIAPEVTDVSFDAPKADGLARTWPVSFEPAIPQLSAMAVTALLPDSLVESVFEPIAQLPWGARADEEVLLALPLSFDLGAGEGPFDDAERPLDRADEGPAGFSDALLQLQLEQPVGGPFAVLGSAAVSRFQDLGFVEGLPDTRFAWLTVGLGVSF